MFLSEYTVIGKLLMIDRSVTWEPIYLNRAEMKHKGKGLSELEDTIGKRIDKQNK